MANPNPSPETRFKPGQSGNPNGRPRELGPLVKKLTLQERIYVYNKFMFMTINQLFEFSKNPNNPINEMIIAKALLTDLQKGGLDNYERLLERLLGKVPQKSDAGPESGEPEEPPTIFFQPVRAAQRVKPPEPDPPAPT